MIYILARHDVEGIQELIWAGCSLFEAESKFKELVNQAKLWRERYKELQGDKWKIKDIRGLLEREFGEEVDFGIASEIDSYIVYGLEGTDKRICFVEQEWE